MLDSDYKVTVYSPTFATAISVDAVNFTDWLLKWDTLFADKTRKSFSLATKLYKYSDSIFGNVKVEIVNDPFSYVASLVTDSDALKSEYGNDQFWSDVAKYVKRDEPFTATIDYALNIGHSFDPISVLARFGQLTDTVRTFGCGTKFMGVMITALMRSEKRTSLMRYHSLSVMRCSSLQNLQTLSLKNA